MSVQLLDVVLLVEDRGHVGGAGGVPGAGAGLQAELCWPVPYTERVANLDSAELGGVGPTLALTSLLDRRYNEKSITPC